MSGGGVLFDLPAGAYHADDVGDTPSLSSSIAHILCTQTPAHAFVAHPKLNPDHERRAEKHLELGTAAHAILLEGRTVDELVVEVAEENWKKKAAQELRAETRAAGLIPMLSHEIPSLEQMVDVARQRLADHGATPPLFTDGVAEPTLVWEEDGVVCRARPDWLRDDRRAIDDLKTTGRSADPFAYARRLCDFGGDVQVAFYLRGLRAVTGSLRDEAEWRWVLVETSPPYEVAVVSPTPAMLAIGTAKVERAIAVWRRCLESGVWPGYEQRVFFADPPAWEEARWLEREALLEEAAA